MLFLVGLAVGGLVLGLLAWTVVRHRRGPDSANGALPEQVRANIPLEVAYTAVPLAIVVVLFGLTLHTQGQVTKLTADPGLRVEATGFQWGWRFVYPADGVTVLGDANRPPTLVLPRGVTTRLVLDSPDVIHSFYVPAFLVKKDVVPGTENQLDVTPTRTGHFGGYCAEFCGLDHARMTFEVEVLEPPEFERWLADRAQEQRRAAGDRQGQVPSGTDDPGAQAVGDPASSAPDGSR